ncbi:cortical protein KAR9-domain-containing protein [Podospora fimiseda]|uniref:Cortical protein KAR9-domain-containing protein n=1 Tax=Podospora fimiseda TaxID=252190 RepID=A0AAN7BWM1_9PEZI|nr:cortical protein KAR9-domain-containing protein [Podospora fimiseda]
MPTLAATTAAPGSNNNTNNHQSGGGGEHNDRGLLAAPAVIVADADLVSATRNATLTEQDTQDTPSNGAAVSLTFSDLSSEFLHLHTSSNFDVDQQLAPLNTQQQQQQQQQHQLSAQEASSPGPRAKTPTTAQISRSRKPSPGLAARLKALGFGSARKPSSPPSSSAAAADSIGRLPEEQLRKLDQGHQANSTAAAIERRGRPWRGALIRIPSRSSLKSDKSHGKAAADDISDGLPSAVSTPVTPQLILPEITATQPLDMDTMKYRLPDHMNGNGVKAQLETRDAHLARDTRHPQASEIPPPPVPKDTPPPTPRATSPMTPAASSVEPFNPDSLTFNPLGLKRTGSIYTLSRASFANQLAQLTSLQLPDAASLSSKVSAIPTAQAAAKALIGAADQIRGWIYKASEVIGGLESDDDVEWAAAGGREGVEDVENAIIRFEELIKVYVGAIEEVQARDDIGQVSPTDLRKAVAQMEAILDEWEKMRGTLHNVKAHVEIAMEWEELWNMVLGDIQNEMDQLSRLVFEMEERRHKSVMGAPPSEQPADNWDLETITEETARPATRLPVANNRFALPPFPVSPSSPSFGVPAISQDDSSLFALFARLQPLRASLDFLPMRLSGFEARADSIFPTACEELEMRRADLDASYRKLEKDAESLRKELGEDRWILVFRNAGRQAQKMYESVERSAAAVREGLDLGLHLTNQPAMAKKIESYETKKTHYGEAVERVLSIIDKGVKDRFTVNGEIVRLHTEMQAKWDELKERMVEIDASLERVYANRKGQHMRDSVSSLLSNDRSTTAGSGHATPQTSPPSSVIMSNKGSGSSTNLKSRSTSGESHLPKPGSRRQSLLPAPTGQLARKPVASRMSTLSVPSREGSATPTGSRSSRPTSSLGNRPKWNSSTNLSDVDTGHNFKPLTLTTPSPYAKRAPTPSRSASSLTPSSSSRLPTLSSGRSPFNRSGSEPPMFAEDTTPSKPASTPSRMSFRDRIASSPGLHSQNSLLKPRLASQESMQALTNNRRASLQPPRPLEASPDAHSVPRPASSLAPSRRTSLLPQPRSVLRAGTTGRISPQALAGARSAYRNSVSSLVPDSSKPKDYRPRWRG